MCADPILSVNEANPCLNCSCLADSTLCTCSNIKRLMAASNLTTMWSDSCIWISDDAYGGQAYEDMPQSDSDSCVPCWQSSVACSNITYKPSAGVSGLQGSRRDGTSNSDSSARPSAFDDLVDVGKRTKRALASGTHGIERYAGTFILPSDTVRQTRQNGICSLPLGGCCNIL